LAVPSSTRTATTGVVLTATATANSTSPPTLGTATGTVISTGTAIGTVIATGTADSTATTGVSGTATETTVPTVSPTVCLIQFTDVPQGYTFYPFVRCLACRGVFGGYACGHNPNEPCDPNNNAYFRPGALITRGQIAKIVSNSAGFNDSPGPQVYEDVNSSSPFYVWINRLTNRGYMGGYPCGTRPDEPCVAPENRPYFRPGDNASRGQLSKIVSNTAGFNEPHTEQSYTDVPTDAPFYIWIERLTTRGVMGGYACGDTNPETGQAEPCDATNRPYFRSANSVTRGQTAKIVSNTFFPGCNPPFNR
ncbi:MAG: S-layer homology domain-containing protein, partial [Chloroflexota bacterium]|nr:S-layer homology domain-containing protein [Chloroflexota bacterium]